MSLETEDDRIRTYFGPNSGTGGPIEDMVTTIASDFNTELKLGELEGFYNQHVADFGVDNRGIKKAIQNTKANINWMKMNYDIIVDWLENHVPTTPTSTTNGPSTTGKASNSHVNRLSVIFCFLTIWLINSMLE